MRLLDALEERVVVRVEVGEDGGCLLGSGGDFLIGVVLEDLLAVRDLDLLGRSVDAEVRETEDGVVVVFLEVKSVRCTGNAMRDAPSTPWGQARATLRTQARHRHRDRPRHCRSPRFAPRASASASRGACRACRGQSCGAASAAHSL